MFNRQCFKAHANNLILWLRISAVSHELTFDVNVYRVVQYIELQLIEYYDISIKADCGGILIIHNQKSWYRTPLHWS